LLHLEINVNLEKFEDAIYYNKVQLPLYPFQRITYKQHFGYKDVRVLSDWLYNWTWLPEASKPNKINSSGSIIIFDDGSGISEADYESHTYRY